MTAFIGVPSTWGLLLRTINTRPRELTCIATSGQGIIAACGNIVNIYDAVTGVLQQSLSSSEPVTKIQASPDGSTLFFAHSFSVTMWDVQTGGLVHTYVARSVVNDIAVSASEGHIACGSSSGAVAFWNIRTKGEGRSFPGNGQPVVTVRWLSPQKLAVATHNSLYIRDITAGKTVDSFVIPNRVWGMLHFGENDEFLVGTSQLKDQVLCSVETISHRYPGLLDKRRSTENRGRLVRQKLYRGRQSSTHPGQLTRPTLVGKNIACISLPMGVQLFDTSSYDWIGNPPLLGVAESVAVSLNRNLVAQTKDSIQIFSTGVLMSSEARNDPRVSHIYPLGTNYIICVLQPTRHLAVLELETLRELRRDDQTLPFGSLLTNELRTLQLFFFRGVNTKLDIPAAMRAWWVGNPLPEGIKVVDQDEPRLLYGLSPTCTSIATVNTNSRRRELRINDTRHGDILARLLLKGPNLGEARDLIFDSETRFYLEIEGPENIRIPYDIIASSSDPRYQYTITEGKAMDLSEIRAMIPYTLDANCQWVLDAQSRKICWISPGNLRRGCGGHFWVGSSLFMVGGDGVVRKVSFREPDC